MQEQLRPLKYKILGADLSAPGSAVTPITHSLSHSITHSITPSLTHSLTHTNHPLPLSLSLTPSLQTLASPCCRRVKVPAIRVGSTKSVTAAHTISPSRMPTPRSKHQPPLTPRPVPLPTDSLQPAAGRGPPSPVQLAVPHARLRATSHTRARARARTHAPGC